MSQFIAKKNRSITDLHDTIKEQKQHIVELENELQQNKLHSDSREVKLLQKFCLILNAKKKKIDELMKADQDSDSYSDEEILETQKSVLEQLQSKKRLVDPGTQYQNRQLSADTFQNVSDQDLINSQVRLNTLAFLQKQTVSKTKHELMLSKRREALQSQQEEQKVKQKAQK